MWLNWPTWQRSCVCVLFEHVTVTVSYQTAWVGYRRTEGCDVSRNQHNIRLYNVVNTGSFARVCVSAFFRFISEISQPAASVTLKVRLSKSVPAVVSYLIKKTILYFLEIFFGCFLVLIPEQISSRNLCDHTVTEHYRYADTDRLKSCELNLRFSQSPMNKHTIKTTTTINKQITTTKQKSQD